MLSALALVAGQATGLGELRLIGLAGMVALVIAVPFAVLPTRVDARLSVQPRHTTAGGRGLARLEVTNLLPAPLLHPTVRIPVEHRQTYLRLPLLRRGRPAAEEVDVPTERRGVVDIGPVWGTRADPLGLLRREQRWADPVEFYVRPRIVGLQPLPPGGLHDLEGVPSDQTSMTDLAFHALREYVPGDDLRHVHWRSSARAGELLVRQYHDTRRSHACVVVDDARDAYLDAEDFELALQAAASLIVRAGIDDYETALVCGVQQAFGDPGTLLDACCRAHLGGLGLLGAARQAMTLAPDTSLLVLITGRKGGVRADETLMRAAREFPAGVRTIAISVDRPDGELRVGIGELGGFTLTALDDLPAMLNGLARFGR
ncbi:DUF58 domain-containing protein [Nocardioides sp. InS609-2]|uniref:DUF58 domain-containing protein n=1 Tax=Nocardioides sp. InS609-2 TaxID=2760705 RepID=UPI0020BD8ED7|nr:DUF58 domain-containing protein [Nocardioides sp. InS609-2]